MNNKMKERRGCGDVERGRRKGRTERERVLNRDLPSSGTLAFTSSFFPFDFPDIINY